jgi:hypothetical protein
VHKSISDNGVDGFHYLHDISGALLFVLVFLFYFVGYVG